MNENKPTPIFADGITFYRPKEGSPEWIKGEIVIHAQRLNKFLAENIQYQSEKGFCKLDLKVSKDKGTLYLQLNTWKPEQKVEESKTTSKGYSGEVINPDDIPFD